MSTIGPFPRRTLARIAALALGLAVAHADGGRLAEQHAGAVQRFRHGPGGEGKDGLTQCATCRGRGEVLLPYLQVLVNQEITLLIRV